MVVNDRPIDTVPQQAAHRVAAGHVNAGQDDATNSAPIDSPEQTDLVLGIPVDEQVGHGPAITVEIRSEGCVFLTDRIPAGAAVPVVVV